MTVDQLIDRSCHLMTELMDTRDLKSSSGVNTLRQMVLALVESSIREAYQLGLDNGSDPR